MLFKEKLVLKFPLAHYGMVGGLINCSRDVEFEEFNSMWHAEVNVGCDSDGEEIPYYVEAHGYVSDNGEPTTKGLWLSVETDSAGGRFKVLRGIKIVECV